MGSDVDAGGEEVRAAVAARMVNDREHLKRVRPEAIEDLPRIPQPTEKPDPRAQWDEAAGRWEIWSKEANGWVSLDDGSVQSPGTRSVDRDTDTDTD